MALATALLPYQVAWINDGALMKLGDKSRRTGWTYVEAYDAVSKRYRPHNNVNRDYWFSSADESAGLEFIEYCRFFAKNLFEKVADVVTEELIDTETRRSATALVIRCPNGKKIVAMTSNPRRFRSKGGDVCLDEFAFHDDPRGMFDAASPVTMWGGSIRIFSTPNGEGSYYNTLVQNCRKVLRALGVTDLSDRSTFPPLVEIQNQARAMNVGPVFSYHRVTIEDAIAQGIVEKINQQTGGTMSRAEFLQSCRDKSRDEDAFNQEYMCEPSTDASAWLPYALIESCEHDDCPQAGEALTGYDDGLCDVGVDVGRTHDRTTIFVLENVGDVRWLRQLLVFQNMSLPDQQRELVALLQRINLRRCCIDATGIGLGLSEFTQDALGSSRIEGVHFTAPVKEDLAVTMKQAFEDKTVRITPNDATLREDLHSVRKTVTTAGNIRFEGEKNKDGHADRFWGLALALHAGKNPSVPFEFTPGPPLRFGPTRPVRGRW